MSITDISQVASASPSQQRPVYRIHWRRWLIPPAVLVVALLAASIAYVATYQPLNSVASPLVSQWRWPGVPAGIVKKVNTFGGAHQDLYAPPQPGWFSLDVGVVNGGPFAVTIESVTIRSSDLMVGKVRSYSSVSYPGTQPALHRLHGLVLPANSGVHFVIPLRAWACGREGAWIRVVGFTVTEKFLNSTRSVVLPLDQEGDSLFIHPLGMPGERGVICAAT